MKRTRMNERELKRAAVLSRVAKKGWTLKQAAQRMGLSYRQGKRLWKRYQAKGAEGLVHMAMWGGCRIAPRPRGYGSGC